MVVAAGSLGEHIVDERASLLEEQLAKAVLFRLEELIEGRLRRLRPSRNVVDRRDVVALHGKQMERSVGDTPAPPVDPGGATPLSPGRRGDRHARRARA